MHLETNLRNTSPTAIGRRPPPFFFTANRLAPHKCQDHILWNFARNKQVNNFGECMNSRRSPGQKIASLRWFALRPDGPGAVPLGKLLRDFTMSATLILAAAGTGSRGRNVIKRCNILWMLQLHLSYNFRSGLHETCHVIFGPPKKRDPPGQIFLKYLIPLEIFGPHQAAWSLGQGALFDLGAMDVSHFFLRLVYLPQSIIIACTMAVYSQLASQL